MVSIVINYMEESITYTLDIYIFHFTEYAGTHKLGVK